MGKTTLLIIAALSLCLCEAGVINEDEGLQSNLVICPTPPTTTSNLLIDTEINEPAHWGVIERTYAYPEAGFFSAKIACILVQDLSTDGKGGTVSTVEGGLNAMRLVIKLRSTSGHGLHYRIQIYS
ncbi:unnamed protein product [Acanthoscelides obtectus]|uniref:Salivary secreted peptide n=1 Tax=Acanthoscelides obtectus TaxID=200917 RepID=A0A9P0L2F7_ACAOB|nr:unnamed protein product [Acanthoscelides obtectus]CAK1677712.1 hypothetical protein AOBTE_LOCUS31502 [Acanthoscelides obtectus]